MVGSQIDFQQILLLPIQVDTTEERTHGPLCTASTGRCITDSTIKYSKAAQPWARLGDVGAAIQEHAEKNGYSVVRDLCGHGVGIKFHEEPDVEHFGKRGTGMLIVPGMTFTIEPMINMGSYEVFIDEADGWTVCTDDGLPSAQWESMILITEDGNEILTQ